MVKQRMDRKALAIAIAVMFVLGMGSSASALSFTGLGSFLNSYSGKLNLGDLKVAVGNYDHNKGKGGDDDRNNKKFWGKKWYHPKKPKGNDTRPVPEPSAALVFGLGLLVASRFGRRAR